VWHAGAISRAPTKQLGWLRAGLREGGSTGVPRLDQSGALRIGALGEQLSETGERRRFGADVTLPLAIPPP